ncbi:MAG TPA: YdcF family protein [Pyrinomonadaceae bacterium]|jgi:uncharacterized SAM-binding protein YcdF (DUF218 family)
MLREERGGGFPGSLRTSKAKRLKRLLLFALLLLAGWALLAWLAAKALMVSAELSSADAIVVLAGSTAYPERTGLAARLYHEGRAQKIILTNDNQQSGWSNELQRNPLFIERAAMELRRAGVPENAIEELRQPIGSTHEEALLVRDYATAHGLRSILIVTSAYHSRRSLWTYRHIFEGSGIRLGLAAVAPGQQNPPPATWWLHLRGWKSVAGEYIKLVYYRLSYG